MMRQPGAINKGRRGEGEAMYNTRLAPKIQTYFYSMNRDSVIHYSQKVLKDWKVISAKRHKDFEKAMKAKKHHLLDLSEFTGDGYTSKQKSGDISGQLEKLNDLYKSGVLTKEEFERAKKKVLK